MSMVAPRLSGRIAAEVFAAVDTHSIGKVAFSQFSDVRITSNKISNSGLPSD
jgi:hypothetical protein